MKKQKEGKEPVNAEKTAGKREREGEIKCRENKADRENDRGEWRNNGRKVGGIGKEREGKVQKNSEKKSKRKNNEQSRKTRECK